MSNTSSLLSIASEEGFIYWKVVRFAFDCQNWAEQFTLDTMSAIILYGSRKSLWRNGRLSRTKENKGMMGAYSEKLDTNDSDLSCLTAHQPAKVADCGRSRKV